MGCPCGDRVGTVRLAYWVRPAQARRAVCVGKIDEHRLRAHIVIPEIVMDDLIRPTHATCIGFERDDGARIFLGLRRACCAEVVGRRIAGRNIDEP